MLGEKTHSSRRSRRPSCRPCTDHDDLAPSTRASPLLSPSLFPPLRLSVSPPVCIEERPPAQGHCIAVRITAENPDQGFQVKKKEAKNTYSISRQDFVFKFGAFVAPPEMICYT